MQHMLEDRGTATKYMAVVSKATGLMRRIICCDNDIEYELHKATMHEGETDVYLTHKEWEKLEHHDAVHDAIAKKAGHKKRPHHLEHRYAHVDENNNVINIVIADPTCGDHGSMFGHNHRLIKHATAEVGHRLKGHK